MMEKTIKPLRYRPEVFDVSSVDAAKAIILTPEGSTTAARWEKETPYLVERMGEFLRPEPDTLVLDYGCGIGRVAKGLIERYGCKVIGVDISPSMRVLAQQYVQSSSFTALSPKEFMDQVKNGLRVDAAYALWVLQHSCTVKEDIAFIKSVLKRHGKFFVLNNRRMAIPTDKGWVDNGIDVFAQLKTLFSVEQEYSLPVEVGNEKISKYSFIACLIN